MKGRSQSEADCLRDGRNSVSDKHAASAAEWFRSRAANTARRGKDGEFNVGRRDGPGGEGMKCKGERMQRGTRSR